MAVVRLLDVRADLRRRYSNISDEVELSQMTDRAFSAFPAAFPLMRHSRDYGNPIGLVGGLSRDGAWLCTTDEDLQGLNNSRTDLGLVPADPRLRGQYDRGELVGLVVDGEPYGREPAPAPPPLPESVVRLLDVREDLRAANPGIYESVLTRMVETALDGIAVGEPGPVGRGLRVYVGRWVQTISCLWRAGDQVFSTDAHLATLDSLRGLSFYSPAGGDRLVGCYSATGRLVGFDAHLLQLLRGTGSPRTTSASSSRTISLPPSAAETVEVVPAEPETRRWNREQIDAALGPFIEQAGAELARQEEDEIINGTDAEAEEPETIFMRHACGRVTVDGWPPRMTISADFLEGASEEYAVFDREAGIVRFTVRFTVFNGQATYRIGAQLAHRRAYEAVLSEDHDNWTRNDLPPGTMICGCPDLRQAATTRWPQADPNVARMIDVADRERDVLVVTLAPGTTEGQHRAASIVRDQCRAAGIRVIIVGDGSSARVARIGKEEPAGERLIELGD